MSHPTVNLRWDGSVGVATHGSVTKKLTDGVLIGGVAFDHIDLSIRTDDAGYEHTYCYVMEAGKPSGRYATYDETAEMVRRLQDMAAAASHALRREHTYPDRIAEWLQGIWQAAMRFPKAR